MITETIRSKVNGQTNIVRIEKLDGNKDIALPLNVYEIISRIVFFVLVHVKFLGDFRFESNIPLANKRPRILTCHR